MFYQNKVYKLQLHRWEEKQKNPNREPRTSPLGVPSHTKTLGRLGPPHRTRIPGRFQPRNWRDATAERGQMGRWLTGPLWIHCPREVKTKTVKG